MSDCEMKNQIYLTTLRVSLIGVLSLFAMTSGIAAVEGAAVYSSKCVYNISMKTTNCIYKIYIQTPNIKNALFLFDQSGTEVEAKEVLSFYSPLEG